MLLTATEYRRYFQQKRGFLSSPTQSSVKFNVYSQYSRVENRINLLKDFCTTSTRRLVKQCLLLKYEVRYSQCTLLMYNEGHLFASH